MKYEVIEAISINDLNRLVQQKLDEGYIISGDLRIIETPIYYMSNEPIYQNGGYIAHYTTKYLQSGVAYKYIQVVIKKENKQYEFDL